MVVKIIYQELDYDLRSLVPHSLNEISTGLFMASNNRIIACGPRMTLVAMGLKFLVGPAIMTVASIVIGLRSRMLKVAIIQVIVTLENFITLLRSFNFS